MQMRHVSSVLAAFAVHVAVAAGQMMPGFINVADFVASDGKTDAADAIQRLIKKN